MTFIFLTVCILAVYLLTLQKEEKQKVFNQNVNVMSYRPTTIANYFIEKHSKDGELTPMKLLKLTYIAYGWYLAITEKAKRLVEEQPIAWDLGPVFPSLYGDIKKSYENWNITKKIPTIISENITEEDKSFLNRIWELYGNYDGVYLSALTHEEGTPWSNVYCKGCNSILTDDSIYEHYKAKLKPVLNE